LGSAPVLAAGSASRRALRPARLAHLAFGAAAVGWALTAVALCHAPRYAAAVAAFGGWIVFSWAVHRYPRWPEWGAGYWWLSYMGALAACLSGTFPWLGQALVLAATAGLSAAAFASIRSEQRRERELPGTPAPRNTSFAAELWECIRPGQINFFGCLLL